MRRYAVIIAGCLASISPAQAQDWIGPTPMDLAGQFSHQIMSSMQMDIALSQINAVSPIDDAPENTKTVPPSQLTYEPSIANRKRNLAAYVNRMRSVDPVQAATMEKLFAQADIIEAVDQMIGRQGMSVNNVADVYALWWATAWQAYSGDDSLGAEVLPHIAKPIAEKLESSPALQSASDSDKQEFSEMLIIQTFIIDAASEASKGNAADQEELRKMAANAGQSMGLDFSKMRLTSNGFVEVAPSSRPAVGAVRASERPRPAISNSAGNAVAASVKSTEVLFTMWSDFQFHARVLFADGTYFDGPEVPPEKLDIAALKRSEPTNWGRWSKTGNRYDFIDDRGERSDYILGEGGLYKSFPATAGATLNATYKSVSGSSVGDMSMLSTSRIRFSSDGRFTQLNDFSASGSGATTGVSMAGGSSGRNAGRYRISGHSIILTFDDGTVREQFFGFGSGGEPPRIDADLIFIGHTSLATED